MRDVLNNELFELEKIRTDHDKKIYLREKLEFCHSST